MEPISLKIHNFYTIADGEINFSQFSSALILGYFENNTLMSNGAGKSSIFEALCWVLFNETRQSKVDDIIRWTTNETFVEFEFIFDRHTYKIHRRRSRIAKESSVSLFIKEHNKWINDSGSTNSDTNKKILQLLKIDATIFLNSVYFKQEDISLFANANPSKRKDIIKSIMKIERWDEYQDQAKNKLRGIKDNIEKQLHIIHNNPNLATELMRIETSLQETTDCLQKLTLEQKNNQILLNSLYETKQQKSLFNLTNDLNANINKINELKIQGKKIQKEQGALQNIIEEKTEISRRHNHEMIQLTNQIETLKSELLQLNSYNLDYITLENTLLSLRVKHNTAQSELDTLNDNANKVSLGQCQFCFSEINEGNIVHIHNNRTEQIQKLEEQLNITLQELNALEAEYKQSKLAKERIDAINLEISNLLNLLDKNTIQKDALDADIIKLTNNNIVMSASLVSIIEQIKSSKIDIEAIERKIDEQKINNIDTQIKVIEEQSALLREEISNKNISFGLLSKEKEFIEQKLVLVNDATDLLSKLGQEKISYEQLVRSFGKEGIQAVFIESVVDELEHYANETLSRICNEPTIIKLRTQKKSGDSWQETLEIDVMMNGFLQTFESLSGGERFRISLALRIGLSEVLVKRAGGEIKLLLLDEVDSQLDAYGVNNLFENIIKGLEKRFKILVVSHNDKLNERFNDIVMVNKTNTGSFVQLN